MVGEVPGWITLIRADNPGLLTLEGTNTWLLDDGTLIDPGPDDEAHLEAIIAAGPVRRILVTHGHPDHIDLVPSLSARTGAVTDELPADIERLATPGHTADSVCYVVRRHGQTVLFSGDTMLGRGSSVVAWPDGNVGDYLASLEQLCAYEGVPTLPGHGPALPDCAAAAGWLLAHRIQRLDQVRKALAGGARTSQEVVEVVYADVDRALWPAAEWSVRAQLDHLKTLGEA